MESIGKILEVLYAVVEQRKKEPVVGSYTNYLLDRGSDKILQKYGEESIELLLAAQAKGKAEQLAEFADVLFHMTVLLFHLGLHWEDVAKILEERRLNSH